MALVASRCPEVPKFLIYTFYILSLIQRFIFWISKSLNISSLFMDYTSSDVSPPPDPIKQAESANLISKLLPVLKYEDLVSKAIENDHGRCTQESCAVCLCEFESKDEIRPLMDCSHIFHRNCLDGWIVHNHRTCPLCRTPFIPIQTQEAVKEAAL